MRTAEKSFAEKFTARDLERQGGNVRHKIHSAQHQHRRNQSTAATENSH